MEKKLTRDSDTKMIAGMATYFGHDVTLWRIAYVIATPLSGFMPTIVFYILAWIIMPPERGVRDVTYVVND